VAQGGIPLVYFLNPTFLMHVSTYLPLWLELMVCVSSTVANEFDLADFSDRFPQSLSKIGRDNLDFVRPINFRIDRVAARDQTAPIIQIKLVSNRVADTLAALIPWGKGYIFFLPPFQNDINGCVDLVKDVLPQFPKELEKSAEKNRSALNANTNPQVNTKKSEEYGSLRDRDVAFARIVGQRTRALREQKGLSREQLAQIVRVPQREIVRLEDGGQVAAATLRRIAEALGVPLDTLIKDDPTPQTHYSVFLSYGGPDEPIARRFYEELTGYAIRCFFFPVSAIPGVRLHRTMSQGVDEYDRVVLLCSQNSLHRPGLLNELEQVLIREAREGGSELLIPIALDDAVFTEWAPERRDLASQVRSRVVADFRRAIESPIEWANQMDRLLQSLTRPRARSVTNSGGGTV
jgi:transcriptional regulator with XRE-family HTH domain